MNLQRSFFMLIASVLLTGMPPSVSGHGYRLGDIAIRHPWATPTQTTDGAGYLTLKNRGTQDDRLIAVLTTAAAKATLYASVKRKADNKAEPINTVIISAGREIRLAPGGPYIRFIGLNQPLMDGDRFSIVLQFQNAGEIAVDMVVQKIAGRSIY